MVKWIVWNEGFVGNDGCCFWIEHVPQKDHLVTMDVVDCMKDVEVPFVDGVLEGALGALSGM